MTPDKPRAKDRRRRTHRQRAARVAGRLRSPRWLVLHAGLYLVINGCMVVTWLLIPDPATVQGVPPGARQQFWPAWTMLLLAVPLGLHATVVLATRPARRPSQPPRPQATSAPGLGGLGGQQPTRAERALATVLFTDIVGSTQRARQVGDRRWAELLDGHDRLARELVDRFGGGWSSRPATASWPPSTGPAAGSAAPPRCKTGCGRPGSRSGPACTPARCKFEARMSAASRCTWPRG